MATITIKKFQVRRSYTAGYRPPTSGPNALSAGEMFRNFADGVECLGRGDGSFVESVFGDRIAQKNTVGQVLGDGSLLTVTPSGGTFQTLPSAITEAASRAAAANISGMTPTGFGVLTGSQASARLSLGLASSAVVEDGVRAAPGNPVGDALANRYDKNASNTTPRTGLFWTAWDQAAAGGLPPPAGRVGAAKIQRLQDRVFIGLAAVNAGGFPSTTKDVLEAFEAARSDPRGFRTSWSQFAVGAEQAGIAVNGYAFASSLVEPAYSGIQLCMGGCFTSVNDNTTVQTLVTALYAVAFRRPDCGVMSGTGTCGGEIDIANEGNSLSLSPASTYPAGGFTTGLQINSGAISPFATDASAALTIGFNGAKFLTGIVIGQNAITGINLDGAGRAISGYGSLIRAGAFQGIEWWNNNGSAPSAILVSEILTPANQQSIRFQDTGIVFGGGAMTGRVCQMLYVGAATGAWFQMTPAVAANPAKLTVAGVANASLAITAVGDGRIVFDRASSLRPTAGASAGFMEILVEGGGDPLCFELRKRA